MLTDFISKAAREMGGHTSREGAISRKAAAVGVPVIKRNGRDETGEISIGIYGRAREIYFRARQPNGSRA